MKRTALITALSVAITAMIDTSAIAAPRKPAIEKSTDVLRPQPAKKQLRALAPLAAPGLVTAAAAPTEEEVGDPESFGRNVTYLGLAQTQSVLVTGDCTGTDPTVERCILANPAPAPTTFNESNLATIELPGKATKSLLCFTLTPNVQVGWFNPLATPANARFNASALITIDNEVLDDPALIDPFTGLPFGGTLSVGLTTFSDVHTLQPGETDNKTLFMSRAGIAGIISKRVLVSDYGFTDNQAKEFFKKPMTLTFGARGTVALADYANYFYGFRLYGD